MQGTPRRFHRGRKRKRELREPRQYGTDDRLRFDCRRFHTSAPAERSRRSLFPIQSETSLSSGVACARGGPPLCRGDQTVGLVWISVAFVVVSLLWRLLVSRAQRSVSGYPETVRCRTGIHPHMGHDGPRICGATLRVAPRPGNALRLCAPYTTLLFFSSAICCSLMPSSVRISAVCSPSCGGACIGPGRAPSNHNGGLTPHTSPSAGCAVR
jgi:hypothetical protein